jgi:hypothetical protein
MTIQLLESIFINDQFNQFIGLTVNEATEKLATLAKQLNLPFEETDLKEDTSLSETKRWELFSRIRFEYVKPTCTMRTAFDTVRVPVLLTEDEKRVGLVEYFLGGLTQQDKTIPLMKQIKANKTPLTVGYAMKKHYETYHTQEPITQSKFPALYILQHDFHHVLLGKTTSPSGELEVSAFESAMVYQTEFPILIFEQLEIMIKQVGINFLDTPELLRCWNLGLKTKPLFESFDLASVLDRPLKEIRQELLCV